MIEPETNIIAFKPRTNVAHHPKSLMERIYAPLGLGFTFVDMRDVRAIERDLLEQIEAATQNKHHNPMLDGSASPIIEPRTSVRRTAE